MLECKNITVTRGERMIFENLDLRLGEGEVVVLRGANGSGKTSLIRAIAGFLPLSSGDILWDGIGIHKDYEGFCKDTHYIGHKNALNRNLTVLENLLFRARLADTEESLEAAVVFLRLEKLLDMPVYMLSQGWQRRVAMARLMISNRKLWLLDEPLVNIDSTGEELLAGLIQTRITTGGMALIASHKDIDLDNAKEISL